MKSLSINRREFIYCVSGLLFALALFLTILTQRYGGHLESQRQRVHSLIIKTRAMKTSAKEMEGFLARFSTVAAASKKVNPREVLLASIDEIKKRFSASSIILTSFDDEDGVLSIGAEISAPLVDYASFVRNVFYLESMTMPWFVMKKVVINGDGSGYNVTMSGIAMLPSRKNSGE